MEGLLFFVGFYGLIALVIVLYKYLSKAYELLKYNNKFKKIYHDIEVFEIDLLKQKMENLLLDFQEQKKSLNHNFKFTYDREDKDLIQGDEKWRHGTTRKKSYKKNRRY